MNEESKLIDRKILKIKIVFMLGPILIGLALFGLNAKPGGSPNRFLDAFLNPTVAKSALTIGALLMLAEFIMLRPLWAQKKALEDS